MRRYQIVLVAIVTLLSAGGGGAIGYAVGASQSESSGYISDQIHEANIQSSYLASIIDRQFPSPSALHEEYYSGPEQARYLLSTDLGFVAVFYVENDNQRATRHTLKERTMTPESALSPEEQRRLADGIYIYTEEQLIRALQDYGS